MTPNEQKAYDDGWQKGTREFVNFSQKRYEEAYAEWDRRWRKHYENAVKEAYVRGLKDADLTAAYMVGAKKEKDRILKLIEGMRRRDVKAKNPKDFRDQMHVNAGFNTALDTLKEEINKEK